VSPPPVWLDDRFIDAAKGSVPIRSLTVTQGVGAYETLRLVHGHAPWIERHVERLRKACDAMQLPGAERDWASITSELSRRCALPDARVRITIGDGFALVTCDPLPPELERERNAGVRLRSNRMLRPDPQLKSVSRWPLVELERKAGGEVLLTNSSGHPLETTRANLFVGSGDRLLTAPETLVLPGIARAIVLEIATEQGIPVLEALPPADFASRGFEVFLTNAIRGVRPVVRIDDHALSIGSLSRRIQEALDLKLGM